MKILTIVVTVVALHVLLIGSALLIGGCKSLPPALQPKLAPPPPPPVVMAPPGPPTAPPLTPPGPVAERSYKVKAGDTLSKIAKSEGVSLSALLAANNLTAKSVIHPGQTITIPAGRTGETGGPTVGKYTVKAGDSLSKVAKTHGTTVDALMEVNHLKIYVIRVGQTLKIPTTAQTTSQTSLFFGMEFMA